jgi:hypothetical protein
VDGASVYWTDYDSGTVMKVPRAGGALTQIAAGQLGPHGIAVNATSVYWTDMGSGTVMKATPK